MGGVVFTYIDAMAVRLQPFAVLAVTLYAPDMAAEAEGMETLALPDANPLGPVQE